MCEAAIKRLQGNVKVKYALIIKEKKETLKISDVSIYIGKLETKTK